jgi:hypothetical protein
LEGFKQVQVEVLGLPLTGTEDRGRRAVTHAWGSFSRILRGCPLRPNREGAVRVHEADLLDVINAQSERQTRKDSTEGKPRAMGQRGAQAADTLGESTE